MKLISWTGFSGASFLQQLTVTFIASVLVMSSLSSFAISTLSYYIVRDKWVEQGRQTTQAFAEQSALALLYASGENAEEPARRFLSFPDVRGVAIYNADRQLLYSKGEAALPFDDLSREWPQNLQMVRENEQAWYFVAPVYARHASEHEASPFEMSLPNPEFIGYVRLVISKQTLNVMQSSILWTTLLVTACASMLFSLFLLGMSQRLTSPLKKLAISMGKASAGEKQVRAQLMGPRDLTEMSEAFNCMMQVLETREKQLELARDAALESARLKGEFAANVSHELRTPLNAVLGMLELLQTMGLTPKQLEYALVARNAGETLLKLIEDILDFSRIESGMMKLQPVDFVLHETLDEVIELMSAQAARKHLQLDYEIDNSIPIVLHGEASRLRQVLINLIGNALKFTEHGSIKIYVAPESLDQEPLIISFKVSDTGVGISTEGQSAIFDAFVQVDGSSTRQHEGAGLGLAICRQLVQLMGGQIGVVSKLGEGSTFWFKLPFDPPCGIQALSEARQAYFSHLRILLVTDNDKMREFLAHALERWQIAYQHSAYGFAALQALRAAFEQGEAYQFMIVDLADSEDIDWIRGFNQDTYLSSVKIILLSHPNDTMQLARLSNVAANLMKPVQVSKLYDFILTLGQNNPPEIALPEPIEAMQPIFPGSKILVVEDNRASQMVAIGMLERLGCRFEIAASGVDALKYLEKETCDLILMDCHMPVMDGFETTRRIRLLPEPLSKVPIVAMTANVQQGDRDLCKAAGMDDYLAKPIKLNPLREKLSAWLPEQPVLESPAGNVLADGYEPLNSQVLSQLREEIGQSFVKMLEYYLEDTPLQLQQIATALADQDFQKLTQAAHAIKGASRNLGAERLAAIAKQMEDCAANALLDSAELTLEELRKEYQLIESLLRGEMSSGMPVCRDKLNVEPRVLVADDDRAMRFALQDVLEKDGYRVDQVSNGKEALALCRLQMPDLILMDAMMPEMDGFHACEQIRHLPDGDSVPILMVTALENDHSVELAFTMGANDYIPKPIHFAVLRQRIAHLLAASRTQRTLNRLAYHDPLTNLANRTQFIERVGMVIRHSLPEQQIHAVLFLDLDRFKLTNDTLGHDVGDLLLKAAAERIQNCVRKEDLVSRFGGDEFTLLLEKLASPQVAAMIADKICHAISRPFVLMGQEFYISASIGISLYPADGDDSGILVKHADTAMYRAKEHGNTYRFYEESMESAVSSKLRLESDLRRALQREEFFLSYQPQINLTDGWIIGAEALIRWQHPELGLIMPDVFIPVAEEIGLIGSIGDWVLREACRQNKIWQRAGFPPFAIAVNVSARQFEQDDFAQQIIAIANEIELSTQYLELELTESLFIRNPEKNRAVLVELKQAGMKISIDDFGTGYSSLNQLKHFEFDKLKIDKSFVANIMYNSDDAAIVLAIISIAKLLKFKVIAEGVETLQQADYLLQSGCDEAQGYYFGKPMLAEAFSKLLTNSEKSVQS